MQNLTSTVSDSNDTTTNPIATLPTEGGDVQTYIEALATTAYQEFAGRLDCADGKSASLCAYDYVMKANTSDEANQLLDEFRIERLAADAYLEFANRAACVVPGPNPTFVVASQCAYNRVLTADSYEEALVILEEFRAERDLVDDLSTTTVGTAPEQPDFATTSTMPTGKKQHHLKIQHIILYHNVVTNNP